MPIVAMLAPQVADWAERRAQPVSWYLMPISFAAILGGTVTAIGTSTNLVVSGLLEAQGQAPLGMFEITPVGLVLAVTGVLTIILLAPVLLPDRRGVRRRIEEETREFVVEMLVEKGGPVDGRGVEAGGLRHLEGVFLAQIEREGEIIAPPGPDTVLRGGDRLCFVGRADLAIDLQAIAGLRSSAYSQVARLGDSGHAFFEAVVSGTSPLANRTLREVGFRGRYQAVVIAIHRAGERVQAKLGEVALRAGDTLVLLSDAGWRDRWRDRGDFLLVSRLDGRPPASTSQARLVALITAAVVIVAGAGLMPILHAALAGAIALVATGVLTPSEARSAVDLDVIIVIAASFALGAAIEAAGLARLGASAVVGAFATLGPRGLLFGVILVTVMFTELITNNAAAVLVFPIAVAVATASGLDPRPFAIGVLFGASASFLTPIGYQTNTMVYGPGGYRFGDYARLGLPATLLMLVVVTSLIPFLWSF
jgi:di/tricarboxylate transporter